MCYDVGVKFLKTIWSYLLHNHVGQWIPVFLILAIGAIFYFQNLGNQYITLWDEVVHVNVVKNLSQNIWPPKLHLTDIGSDFQDWTNNYIWVHKPLLPLYLQAGIYKIFPSLFAFRLPGVIFALLTALLLFWLVKKHFDVVSAWVASGFWIINPYILELVTGRQFSGLHDLMFVSFGLLALNQILNMSESNDIIQCRQKCWLFGLFTGLAYLSKGGLALLFFIPFFSEIFHKQRFYKFTPQVFKHWTALLYAGLWTSLIIFPEKIYLLIMYPAEYFFEQSLQVLHLFKYLEYWGRPWDYYLTVYLRDIFMPQAYLVMLSGLVFALYVWDRQKKIRILAIWILAFLIPLSVGMTKISNFMLVVLPVFYILLAQFFLRQIQTKKYALVMAYAFLSIMAYGFIRLDVAQIKFHFFQEYTFIQRSVLLIFSGLCLGGMYAIFKFINAKYNLAVVAKGVLVCSILLVVGTYLRAMQINNQKVSQVTDFLTQKQLRDSAMELKAQLPAKAIVLTHFSLLKKSHLYFQYFSGLDAMEIYNRQPLFLLIKQMPKNRPVYVLSDSQLEDKRLRLINSEPNFFYEIK